MKTTNYKRSILISIIALLAAGAAFHVLHVTKTTDVTSIPTKRITPRRANAVGTPEAPVVLADPPASTSGAPATPRATPLPEATPTVAAPASSPAPADEAALPDIPAGALRSSMVLHFQSDEELLAFVKAAQARGISILGILGELKAVRIGLRGDSSDAAIFAFANERAQTAFDYPVAPPTPLPAEGDSGTSAFGGSALAWLGVPEANLDWGKGVTLAVLDSPLAAGALTDANVDRVQPEVAGLDPELTDHGTTVSSLIVGQDAQSHGIAPATHLVHIDVLESGRNGSTFGLAEGILEAIDRGAQVISISLATTGDSRVLREAIKQAAAKGIAIVAAVGNEAVQSIPYPAAYDSVLAVGAVDANGLRATFSNTGPQVDIAAPGVGMNASAGPDRFGVASGTSLSTPLVAGMIAKVLSDDRSLTPRQAAEIVLRYANDTGLPGADDAFGLGILNASRILDRDTRGIRDVAIADNWVTEDARGNLVLIVSVQNRGTESMSGLLLDIQIGEAQRNAGLGTLAPGEVGSAEIALDRVAAQTTGGIAIQSEVIAPGDEVLQNNRKRTIVRAK